MAWWGTNRLPSRAPARRTSRARRCFRGSRGSNRYTRTFESTTQAAVVVEILPRPAPVLRLLPASTLLGLVRSAIPRLEEGDPFLGGEHQFPTRPLDDRPLSHGS